MVDTVACVMAPDALGEAEAESVPPYTPAESAAAADADVAAAAGGDDEFLLLDEQPLIAVAISRAATDQVTAVAVRFIRAPRV
jgi:hypothetical protein